MTDPNVRQVIPRDAIPSVDDPQFVTNYDGSDDGLSADDEVIVVERDGDARAYPVRYLHYHEIVNDTVSDQPIAVTWCPLCGCAVVYDRRVDGTVLTFGVSGKLADDDLVMYDRETESEWKQSSGRCLDGPHDGATLHVLPATMSTWAAFRDRYPDGVVLAPPGGESEASGNGDDIEPIDYAVEPYRAYFGMDGFGLRAHRGTNDERTWNRGDIDAKTVVLGVEMGTDALGFPLPVVEDEDGIVEATVGETRVVVFATGDGIHAFEHPGYEFVAGAENSVDGFGEFHARADGARWNGATGESDDGRRLTRLPTRRLFAFTWQDDHGRGSFYGLD